MAVNVFVDVGHRTFQILRVLRIPAADERVVSGNTDADIGLRCFCQRQSFIARYLTRISELAIQRTIGDWRRRCQR